jgi:gliding motility-associated-like protein
VKDAPEPVNLAVKNPDMVCGVGSADLTAPSITDGSGAGLQFSYWMDADATSSVINPKSVGAGTYYIKAVSSGGCYVIRPVVVALSTTPYVSMTGATICSGTSGVLTITVNGRPPFDVVYTDGVSIKALVGITSPYQLTVSPAQSTTYRIVSVSDAECTNNAPNASAVVNVTQTASSIRYPTVTARRNQPVQLSARSLGSSYTYSWNPPVGLNSYSVQKPVFRYDRQMEYTIAIASNTGCTTVDTLLVVMAEESGNTIVSDLFVPKAWTPNGDGHNDKLYPLTVNIKQLYYFRIFDRWGQLMFETSQIGKGWDGVYKNKPQVMDVYTWTVEAIGEDGRHFKRSGNSVLLR